MSVIRITISTEPQAKGRPKTVFHNGKARTYTPQRTKDAEDFLRYRLLKHKDNAFPAHTPVRLSVTFYRTKSKYLSKKETMPFRKPDLDNLLKTCLDSMNDILIADDAQITTIIAKKRWSKDGEGHINIKMEKDDENNQESTD